MGIAGASCQLKMLGIFKRFVGALALAAFLAIPFPTSSAAPRAYSQQKALRRRQKAERKQLKQQQAAMKKVMSQHPQSAESKKRFRQDMKMQRKLLHRKQKEETRRIKNNHRAQKARLTSR